MVKEKKDLYKRVYCNDGAYHYPKVPENNICSNGKEYFQNLELTGSSKGTAAQPKMSLLKVYKETIVPAFEEKVVRRFNNGGRIQVCIVKQQCRNCDVVMCRFVVRTIPSTSSVSGRITSSAAPRSHDCTWKYHPLRAHAHLSTYC